MLRSSGIERRHVGGREGRSPERFAVGSVGGLDTVSARGFRPEKLPTKGLADEGAFWFCPPRAPGSPGPNLSGPPSGIARLLESLRCSLPPMFSRIAHPFSPLRWPFSPRFSFACRSSPLFRGDPELSAAVSAFRGWAANAEAMAEKYSAAPAPIDFASAKKSSRDPALIEALEQLYKNNEPPAETYEWSAEDQAEKAKQIEDAKARQGFTQEMIEDAERELAFMKDNRLSRDMSVSDMKEIYPDIAEEVETEIENREWFKDTLSK